MWHRMYGALGPAQLLVLLVSELACRNCGGFVWPMASSQTNSLGSSTDSAQQAACKGRVALVTGASRGIGRDIAFSLASTSVEMTKKMEAAGNHKNFSTQLETPITSIICVSRGIRGCQETAAHINAQFPLPMYCPTRQRGFAHNADVSNGEEVRSLVANLINEFGKVDILVNNAGVTKDKLLIAMSPKDWREVLSTNLDSVFYFTKAVIRSMMKQKWGRIISISSVTGVAGNPGQTNYAASKAAVIGFTKSIAKEVGGQKITANVVAPGFIVSDMTDKMPPSAKEAALKMIPANRYGETSEIANAVNFLVSDAASYITGSVYVVDGAFMLGSI